MVNFENIPVFIESHNPENECILSGLAHRLTDSVQVLNSDKRKLLHVTAVFACNFVNHFYSIAADLSGSENISFDVLKPLIMETALKVQEIDPVEAQTGPAIRFDTNIINDHLDQLKNFPRYQELYNSISKSIFETHKK